MGDGHGKYSRKIWLKDIKVIIQKNNQITAIKLNDKRLTERHRPTKTIRNLIDIGFERGWFDSSLIKTILVHGFDKKYWNMINLLEKFKEDEEDG